MANIGQIIYKYGPFPGNNNNIIPDGTNMNCKIGVSIDEKDCMYLQNGQLVPDQNYLNSHPIIINICGNNIQIGRTFMYESDGVVNNASISFPNGAPASTKVCIIYS